MQNKYLWAFGGGCLTILCWPVIKVVLYVMVATLSALFGALTMVTTPVQKPTETITQTGTAPGIPSVVSPGERAIMDRLDQDRAHRDQRDDKQDSNIKELGTRIGNIENRGGTQPTATPPPCTSNCGGGEYLEIPR